MKFLIHSNAPWVPSGYGKQAMHAGRILISLGHRVSYSAFSGLSGQPITWQVPGVSGREGQVAVFPSGQVPFGPDVIVPHAQHSGADIVVSIMDTYMLRPVASLLSAMPPVFAPLVITDCEAQNGGPSMADQELLEMSGALPGAVSRFGQDRLRDFGPDDWKAPYVPHLVDTEVFKPTDKAALREELGTSSDYIIGIAAANRDSTRKGFPEQFAAFSRFSRKHPDARLSLFTVADSRGGLRLAEMADDFGILDRCVFMPAYEQDAGMLSDDFMAAWYNSIDLLSNCGYGEGFGVPLLESQACGTPVVATDCSAMTELAREAGFLVRGDRFWNVVHRAWWTRPDEAEIVRAWDRAFKDAGSKSREERAVAFASGYDLDHGSGYWKEFITALEARVAELEDKDK